MCSIRRKKSKQKGIVTIEILIIFTVIIFLSLILCKQSYDRQIQADFKKQLIIKEAKGN